MGMIKFFEKKLEEEKNSETGTETDRNRIKLTNRTQKG